MKRDAKGEKGVDSVWYNIKNDPSKKVEASHFNQIHTSKSDIHFSRFPVHKKCEIGKGLREIINP